MESTRKIEKKYFKTYLWFISVFISSSLRNNQLFDFDWQGLRIDSVEPFDSERVDEEVSLNVELVPCFLCARRGGGGGYSFIWAI